jgi:hypothetical protein
MWQEGLERKAVGEIRSTEAHDAVTAVRMMLCERPDDWRSPVVTYPDSPLDAQMVEQFAHVEHGIFDRIFGA